MTLTKIAEKYRTDKVGSIGHNYVSFYEMLFPDPDEVFKVLEVGIGYPELMKHVEGYEVGPSLKMWRDYFPRAWVYGMDNQEQCAIEGEDRITTVIGSQDSEDDVLGLRQYGPFDLVIDDGSHKTEDQIFTMLKLATAIKSTIGYYIIEDVKEPEKVISAVPPFFDRYVIDFHHTGGIDDRLVLLKWKK